MRSSYLKALETQAKWHQWRRPYLIDEPSYLLVMSKWYEVLKGAETLYMGKEFCSLVDTARRTVPDDLEFEDSWVPCEKGFLYLETPFAVPRVPGLPVDVTIRAVGWMPNTGGTLFLFALEGMPGIISNRSNWHQAGRAGGGFRWCILSSLGGHRRYWGCLSRCEVLQRSWSRI